LPAHGVNSVPVRRYVLALDGFAIEPEVAVVEGAALPAVPVAPAVAVAGAAPLPGG